MKTIIQNGTIVTSEAVFRADIEITGEKITAICAQIIPQAGDKVVDATGNYIFPGGIDVHTHMASTHSPDSVESGSKAAAVGGTTSMIIMAGAGDGESLLESVNHWKQKAKTSFIDYSFHPIIRGTQYKDQMLDELQFLAEKEGITSIKMFMAYQGTKVNDSIMYKVMKRAAELGIISCIHAENGSLIEEMVKEAIAHGKTDPIYHAYSRPEVVESEATARAIAIAEAAHSPVYIVHVSCTEALHHVEQAKRRGLKVYGETCPHYVALDMEYLTHTDGAKYVCSPPLRDKENQYTLWDGINRGVISTIGSDHSPNMFHTEKKDKKNFAQIKNGVPGIEDRFSIMYHYGVHENKMPLQKFVDVMATAPAKLFGIRDKGSITIGYDADMVIFDPSLSRVITAEDQYQQSDYNIYEGMEVQGAITHVFSRGELIVKDRVLVGEDDRGQFIWRKKFPLHEKVNQ